MTTGSIGRRFSQKNTDSQDLQELSGKISVHLCSKWEFPCAVRAPALTEY